MDFQDTTVSGVTESLASDSGNTETSGSAVSPMANDANVSESPEVSTPTTAERVAQEAEEAVGTAPANDEPDIDPAQFEEKARNAFITQRQKISELAAFQQEAKPVYEKIQQRGGWERIERDTALVDSALAEDAETRRNFHALFYEQSPSAYMRFLDDLINDENIQAEVLKVRGIDLDAYKASSDANELSETVQQVMQTLSPEHLEVFKALDPEVQEDLALRSEKVRNYDLEQYAMSHKTRMEVQQQREAWQKQQGEQAQARVQQKQVQAYSDVKSTVKQGIAKLFPGQDAFQEAVTSATESALLNDPVGAKLWSRIESLIAQGEWRKADDEMPQIIAAAQAAATAQAKPFLELAEKARKYDELMRSQVPTRVEPGRGMPVTNGNYNLPKPDARGQYDPANIIALGRN